MDLDPRIATINARLKKHCSALKIERRGKWLWARGTLPPKPYSSKERPFQQRFALKQPATPDGLRRAEQLVIRAGAALRLGEFDWSEWVRDPIQYPQNTGDWVARFEQQFWRSHAQGPRAQTSWREYQRHFKQLPKTQPLTENLLIEVLAQTKPDTRNRQQAAMAFSLLAQLAGLPTQGLKALRGNYSVKSVEPRDLPSDEEIVAMIDAIAHPGWRWVAAMMATYGLRNHEVYHLNLSEFPTIWVEDPTKTGKRFVYPLLRQWCDRWSLCDRVYPNLQELKKSNPFAWDNSKLGRKTSIWFKKNRLCKPYDLRHSYARRCFENRFPADLTAKLMGHSMSMQLGTYRAWWGEATYRQIYEELVK